MILFAILQFINVVLGSLRSITTAKAGVHVAMTFNTISYTLYSAIVYFTTAQEIWFILLVTAITNVIGFYLANFLFKKMQKDKPWRITAVFHYNSKYDSMSVSKDLQKHNIQYDFSPLEDKAIFDIFSYSQGESILIKEILDKYKMKYHVLVIEKGL